MKNQSSSLRDRLMKVTTIEELNSLKNEYKNYKSVSTNTVNKIGRLIKEKAKDLS